MTQSKCGRRRRAVAAVWVALAALILIGIIGLGLDTAYGLLGGHQLQNAADAAALAGARRVRDDPAAAQQAAHDCGAANVAAGAAVELQFDETNDPSGDIVVGRYDRSTRLFDSTATLPNAVKVVAHRNDVPLLFGPIFQVNTVSFSRAAIAIIAGTTGGGLVALCPDCECALLFSGNTDLLLEAAEGWDGDTAIQVNSDDPCAMCGGGSLIIEAPETNLVGDACWNGNPTLNTYINPDSPTMPDPLADLPAPPWNPLDDLGTIQTGAIQPDPYPPGYYSGGIRITSAEDTVVLEPGVYVLDGEGLYVNGGNLTALEVMFYVIGTGRVYLGGNEIINITPSEDENDPYWGISIFQARDNANEATIIGSSNMNLEGSYYFPVAPLEIGGTGMSIGNQLIAWTVWMHGTGTFTVQYDGRFEAPGAKVFLVQ